MDNVLIIRAISTIVLITTMPRAPRIHRLKVKLLPTAKRDNRVTNRVSISNAPTNSVRVVTSNVKAAINNARVATSSVKAVTSSVKAVTNSARAAINSVKVKAAINSARDRVAINSAKVRADINNVLIMVSASNVPNRVAISKADTIRIIVNSRACSPVVARVSLRVPSA